MSPATPPVIAATPLTFAGCRGWLYLPAPHSPVRPGIVFFHAWGVEDLSTRHSMAQLASRLAQSGHATLRFDAPGTGDSVGDWSDTDQLPAWIATGCAAVDTLRNYGRVDTVSLLGLRLGGLVATLVARTLQTTDHPIHDLALLAPVLQGKQYLRELRTLAEAGTPLRVAGFALSPETQEALTATDITTLPAPAQRIFWATHGLNKAASTLQSAWAQQTALTTAPYPDLFEHIGNPTQSRPPHAMFTQLLDWLAADPAPAPGPAGALLSAIPTPTPFPAHLTGRDWTEAGVTLRAEVPLAGVWCEPLQAATPPTPLVILCNAGRNPHIGWARSSVDMARALAGRGIRSLRFDMAGLGDSPPLPQPPDEMLYSDASLVQLHAVLDYVQATVGKAAPIVVLGACSGGYCAFHTAVHDPRVRALVLVNVQRYVWKQGTSLEAVMRTSGKSTQTYLHRSLHPSTWTRLLRGDIDVRSVAHTLWARIQTRLGERIPKPVLSAAFHRPPAPQQAPHTASNVRQGFAQLAARGTEVCVVYSQDDGGRDEFARYFGANHQSFTQLPHTQLVLIPDADHDLTRPDARQKLLDAVLNLQVLSAQT